MLANLWLYLVHSRDVFANLLKVNTRKLSLGQSLINSPSPVMSLDGFIETFLKTRACLLSWMTTISFPPPYAVFCVRQMP